MGFGGFMSATTLVGLSPEAVLSEKFEFQKKVEFVIPSDYGDISLDKFMKIHGKEFWGPDDNIADENFGNPSNPFIPGHKYEAEFYPVKKNNSITSQEGISFLKSKNLFLGNAPGLTLLCEFKKDSLDNKYWNVSFDKGEYLWKDSDGDRRVPGLGRDSGGDWHFSLGYFGGPWGDGHCLVGFRDLGLVP